MKIVDGTLPLIPFHKRHDIGYLAQLEVEFFPFFEVGGNVDVAAVAYGAANAEILLERHVALDSRFLVGGVLPDVVGVAIDGEFAEPGSESGCVGSIFDYPVVYDIKFGSRLGGIALDANQKIGGAEADAFCAKLVVRRKVAMLVEGLWLVELGTEAHDSVRDLGVN